MKKIILIILCFFLGFGIWFIWTDTKQKEDQNQKLNIIVATAKYQDTIPIYPEPNINSFPISELSGQTCLTCNYFGEIDNQNDFIKVELSPNSNGYIKAEDCLIDIIDLSNFDLNQNIKFFKQRIEACQKSLTFLSIPYDEMSCDELIRKSYKAAGIDFGDLPAAKYDDDFIGILISREELKAGDFVFYKGINGGDNTHIALYLGKEYVIHSTLDKGATYPLGGVHITKLDFRSSPTKYRSPFLD